MTENNKNVAITNRNVGSLVYKIPDLGNLRRSFEEGETKKVPVEELRKLSFVPGGQNILKNILLIEDKEVIEELLGQVEPEYFYNKKEIEELLTRGSEDQLRDALDLAPKGVIELIKKIAVELPLNDVRKRDIIQEVLKFNVNAAIMIKTAGSTGRVIEDSINRRAKPVTAPQGNYKVVSKEKE